MARAWVWALLGLVCFFGLGGDASAADPGRFALVIANQDYPGKPGRLRNPPRDAAVMSRALREAGFDVESKSDLDRTAMLSEVAKLASRIEDYGDGAIGFVYYTGHGASSDVNGDRRNYWMPTGVPIGSGRELRLHGVPFDQVLDGLSGLPASAIFVVSDATRDSLPFTEGRATKGFDAIAPRSGLFVAYGDPPGESSPDDGTYARALAEQIEAPGLTADQAFDKAARAVAAKRGSLSRPFVASGLSASVCFNGGCDGSAAPPAGGLAGAEAQAEAMAWRRAQELDSRESYTSYLTLYPDGPHAAEARAALDQPGDDEPATQAPAEAKAAYKEGQDHYFAGRHAQAAEKYRIACEAGEPKGCTDLGYMYSQGEGVPLDVDKARELYERGCDGGSTHGCKNLGILYEKGRGVPQDYAKAMSLYQKACDLGNAGGCTNVGYLYDNGLGVRRDIDLARQYFEKGCDRGNATGCTNLGIVYEKGRGVPVDFVRARALYQKACDKGHGPGCTNLGFLYNEGLGGPKDLSKSFELYTKGCESGNPLGCRNLGVMYEYGEGIPQSFDRARELYARACDAGEQKGCGYLGDLEYLGRGGPRDEEAGLRHMRESCAKGIDWSCNWLDQRGLSR